jgi:hypothetical protein
MSKHPDGWLDLHQILYQVGCFWGILMLGESKMRRVG